MPRQTVILLLAATAASCTRDDLDQGAAEKQSHTLTHSDLADADKIGSEKPDWTAEYAEMTGALDLSQQEDAALKEAFPRPINARLIFSLRNGMLHLVPR